MDRLYEYLDRLLAIVLSRRFQIVVLGIILLLMREQLGISAESAESIRNILIAYVVSESIRPSLPPTPAELSNARPGESDQGALTIRR